MPEKNVILARMLNSLSFSVNLTQSSIILDLVKLIDEKEISKQPITFDEIDAIVAKYVPEEDIRHK